MEAGLHSAIFDQIPYIERLRRIERLSPTKTTSKKPRLASKRPDSLPFIENFKWTKYRLHPVRSEFRFGAVNLIVGPNAVGKTSLLEAIELYYCGRNKRTPDSRVPYDFVVDLVNGDSDRVNERRKPQVFRDRNLTWYGRPEVKTNSLYQSFALYNFLDTDAAVRLSDSTDTIDDDLSRLLVGPETSTIWQTIVRVSEGLNGRIRELDKQVGRGYDDRNDLRKILGLRLIKSTIR